MTIEHVEPTQPTEPAQPVERLVEIEPDELDNVVVSGAARFAPRYLAISCATMLWWTYLVLGEFVLAGIPEWLGWFVVIAAGGASYWSLEQRLAAYLPRKSWKERTSNIIVVCLLCVAGFLLSMIFGTLMPEFITTLMMLCVVGLVTWWMRSKRGRLFVVLAPESGWIVVARVALVGLLTMVAVGVMVARVTRG